LYSQAVKLKENKDLIDKLEFALSLYRTAELLHWTISEMKHLKINDND
jgi:hypothetical protein